MRPQGPRPKEYAEGHLYYYIWLILINRFFTTVLDDESPSLNVIIKADVDGTLEAILEVLDTYESEECPLDIIHYGVGPITPTDVELAKTFNCVIYTFNVPLPNHLQPVVEENQIEVKKHNVIYKLIEDFKEDINKRYQRLYSGKY